MGTLHDDWKRNFDVYDRIGELERPREQIAGLAENLERMEPGQESLPGMAPCACVQLVESSSIELIDPA